MVTYIENEPTSSKAIVALRRSVGWNGMESCYNNPLMVSYYHIACYDEQKNLLDMSIPFQTELLMPTFKIW